MSGRDMENKGMKTERGKRRRERGKKAERNVEEEKKKGKGLREEEREGSNGEDSEARAKRRRKEENRPGSRCENEGLKGISGRCCMIMDAERDSAQGKRNDTVESEPKAWRE